MKVEERFSNRVDNYIKYRPHYPEEVYAFLLSENLIFPGCVIADVGCGTGISSHIFLKNNHKVFGVDPNNNMLQAAATYLKNINFVPVMAPAEHTSLQANSIDFIICAQAFHWFDKEKARVEFKRILKPGSKLALMWNDRQTTSTDFLKVYEDFLQMFGTDYKEVNHKNALDKHVIDAFFGNNNYKEKTIYNFQNLDFEGLKGRVLSSSYMPDETNGDYEHMIYCLKKIFQRYQQNGTVKLDYDTKIYYGCFDKLSTGAMNAK